MSHLHYHCSTTHKLYSPKISLYKNKFGFFSDNYKNILKINLLEHFTDRSKHNSFQKSCIIPSSQI